MIKLFVQPVDYGSPQTIQRDVQTLEDSTNAFIRNSNIVPISVNFQEYLVGAVNYIAVLVEYNIKRS